MKFSPRAMLKAAFVLLAAAGLSACTSTEDVLEPSALAGSTQPATSTTLSATEVDMQQEVAAISTNARVQFAPAIGVPASASSPLSARLSARAAARGIPLIASGQPSATLTMKGYFSAITDAGQTSVIYVWDIINPEGTRIHRIQGQAKAPATSGEGWDSVQPATMETIADDSVDQLATWLATLQK